MKNASTRLVYQSRGTNTLLENLALEINRSLKEAEKRGAMLRLRIMTGNFSPKAIQIATAAIKSVADYALGNVEILVGKDGNKNYPSAIRALCNLQETAESIEARAMHHVEGKASLHIKAYWLTVRAEQYRADTILYGTNNLTVGGLLINDELYTIFRSRMVGKGKKQPSQLVRCIGKAWSENWNSQRAAPAAAACEKTRAKTNP